VAEPDASSRLIIGTPDPGLIPGEFPVPYIEDQWVVGHARGRVLIEVEDPWIVGLTPSEGEELDLAAIADAVRNAPGDRPIVLEATPPHLLAESEFVAGVVAPALARGPRVIINLAS
jgi:hypothetical protein